LDSLKSITKVLENVIPITLFKNLGLKVRHHGKFMPKNLSRKMIAKNILQNLKIKKTITKKNLKY